jgi:predicted GIY-YIG superfamily endonuclease
MNIYQIIYLNQNNKLELYIGMTNKILQQRKNDYIEKNNTISKYIKNNIKKLISIIIIKENAN